MEAAERVVAKCRAHLEQQRYLVLSVEADHYDVSARWVGRFCTALRALDALHLAVARLGEQHLITADRALARSAECFDVPHTLLRPCET